MAAISAGNLFMNRVVANHVQSAGSHLGDASRMIGEMASGGAAVTPERLDLVGMHVTASSQGLSAALEGISTLGRQRSPQGDVQLVLSNGVRRSTQWASRFLEGNGGQHKVAAQARIDSLRGGIDAAGSPGQSAQLAMLGRQVDDALRSVRAASDQAERAIEHARPREIVRHVPSADGPAARGRPVPAFDEFSGEPFPHMIGQEQFPRNVDAFTGEDLGHVIGGHSGRHSANFDSFTGESWPGGFLG